MNLRIPNLFRTIKEKIFHKKEAIIPIPKETPIKKGAHYRKKLVRFTEQKQKSLRKSWFGTFTPVRY